jgi:hypothetical protein
LIPRRRPSSVRPTSLRGKPSGRGVLRSTNSTSGGLSPARRWPAYSPAACSKRERVRGGRGNHLLAVFEALFFKYQQALNYSLVPFDLMHI